jgi:hypothetical protein
MSSRPRQMADLILSINAQQIEPLAPDHGMPRSDRPWETREAPPRLQINPIFSEIDRQQISRTKGG